MSEETLSSTGLDLNSANGSEPLQLEAMDHRKLPRAQFSSRDKSPDGLELSDQHASR